MEVILFEERIWSIAQGAAAARMRIDPAKMTSQAGREGRREEMPTKTCWSPPMGSQKRPRAEGGIVDRASAAWLTKGSSVSSGMEEDAPASNVDATSRRVSEGAWAVDWEMGEEREDEVVSAIGLSVGVGAAAGVTSGGLSSLLTDSAGGFGLEDHQ
jgi:hypothetical protein